MNAPLLISTSARAQLQLALKTPVDSWVDFDERIRGIAAPVVAAELRRLALSVFTPAGCPDEAAVLLSRADELETGAA